MNKIVEWFVSEPVEKEIDLESTANDIYNSTFGNPLFATPYGSRYMINADSTASGNFFKPIEKYINTNVIPYYNNTHSNSFSGQMMNLFITKSKEKIAKSIRARSSDKILFTGNGCTGAIQHIIHLLNLKEPNQNAVVFISEAEHHSNDLPWRHLPIDLVVIPIHKESGFIRLDILKKYLKKYRYKSMKLISMIAASNITGVIQPIDEISILGHKYGALVMFDYATGGSYLPINIHKDESIGNYIDIVVFSPHKFLGGPNTPGLFVVREQCCRNSIPFCPGGGTISFATENIQKYSSDIETRENGGTPNIVGCIKVGLCFELKDKHQIYISKREEWLVRYVHNYMEKIEKYIQILNPKENLHRLPILSFKIKEIHYNLVVVLLNDLFGIQSRGGISCCSMYAQKILDINDEKKQRIYASIINDKGVPPFYGWCRITFHYTMPKYIVDYILKSIEFVAKNAKLFKQFYMYDPKKNNWYYSNIENPTGRYELINRLVQETLTSTKIYYPSSNDLKALLDDNVKLLGQLKKPK